MYIRKVFFVGKLALVVVLAYAVIRIAMMLHEGGKPRALASAASNESVSVVDAMNAPDHSVGNYSAIVEQNLFGGANSSPSVSKSLCGDGDTGLLRSAEEELGLALLGTVAGSPMVSRAIIKNVESEVPGLYKTGDVVKAASIESIEPDVVVLLHNGQRKKLRLSTTGLHHENDTQIHSSQAIQKIGKAQKTALPVEQTPTELQSKIGCVEAILKKAVIEDYVADGQLEGLRITGLEQVPSAKNLGLKNGDIVRTVNGHRLTGKQKAYQIFKKARTQPTMSIELLREGKTKELSFRLK